MKQTKKLSSGWVLVIVQHSEALTYQIFDDDDRAPRRSRPRWLLVLFQAFATGKQIYGLTI